MFSNKLKRMIEVLVILLLVVIAGVSGIFLGYNYVISQSDRFDSLEASLADGSLVINRNTPNAVMVVIESGDDTSDIARKLKDDGLISNTLVFTLMSKFNGFDGGYLSGTHFLTKDLSYDEIMYMLCQEPEVITITFPEGMSYEQIKQKLLDSGLDFDPAKLDECMNSPNLFSSYKFVSMIPVSADRDFILSGYLYPDTYNFDMNASEEEIVDTFLTNMDNKLTLYEDFYDRAEKIGMFKDLYNALLYGSNWQPADVYYILGDFVDYRTTRDRVYRDYMDRLSWARKCWVNICNSGRFSSDRTIQDYVDDIWKIEPLKI